MLRLVIVLLKDVVQTSSPLPLAAQASSSFLRNECPPSFGMSVHLPSESLSSFAGIRIRRQFLPEWCFRSQLLPLAAQVTVLRGFTGSFDAEDI